MKKNKNLLIILFILMAITAIYILRNSETTLKKELRDFAVKDTASISKIFIADRNGNNITLEKNNKKDWLLNGKDEPKPDLLKLLLNGIYNINVKYRVSKAAYNSVIKTLASSGIKCEIYLNDSQIPFKTYYVGSQTEDGMGTFMIIENSNTPFVTEVPGFSGYLTPRYSVDIDAWKLTRLFHIKPQEIKTLSVNYSNFPDKSFTIRLTDGKYSIESPLKNIFISKVDSIAIENYFSFYKNVYYESRAKDLNSFKKDSILQYPPSITISLTDKTGLIEEVYIYPMAVSPSSLSKQDEKGNLLKYDVDRIYGYRKQDKEFVIIQHYTFDKYLRQFRDFDLQRPKESKLN